MVNSWKKKIASPSVQTVENLQILFDNLFLFQAKHILEKKCEELKKMKNALATTKPNSKTAQSAKQYSDLETQLEYLKTLPENQVPLHGKNVSIDWDLIAAR